MARKIQTRWKISGTVRAETPIHVGGIGGDADTDLALAINGRGKYYIPGTSLAGAFRGWMSSVNTNTEIDQLWGFQDQQGNGHASFIIIDDSEIKGNPNIEIREGVGIDRHTGAAADKAKYSRAILPKGITFPLEITFDCQDDQEPSGLWQLLQALEHSDIRIGAAKTRGLGKIKLDKLTIRKHQLSDAKGLFNSLLSQNLKVKWEEIKANLETYRSPAQLSLDISWQPKDPVMVKAEGDGIAVDILPLVSQVESDVRFVIPGSSIKGVLRAHAERIVRTVCHKLTQDDFLKQVELELVNKLFGSAEKKKNQPVLKGDKQQSQGNIGVLFVDDCYATLAMTAEHWSAVENAAKTDDEEFRDFKKTLGTALNTTKDKNPFQTLQPAMHVAVDRWTGGAAEGMLYSVLEPIGVEWEPIGVRLDLARLEKYYPDLMQPAIALLLLVLRDFANRKIPIGYGTNRGMGTVAVTAMQLSCSPIDGLNGIETQSRLDMDLANLGDELLTDLTTAWQAWTTQYSQQKETA